MELRPFSDVNTVAGASTEVVISRDELPMCMQIGRPASRATARIGSQ